MEERGFTINNSSIMIKNIFFVTLIIVCISCHRKTTSALMQTNDELRNLKYIPAKVVLQTELDGCGYLLALEDGKMLDAINLNDTLKRNDLKIWVKYHLEKNTRCATDYIWRHEF